MDMIKISYYNYENAGQEKHQNIDDFNLVGGTTKISIVKKLSKEFLLGKEPNKGVNPNEAVGLGVV